MDRFFRVETIAATPNPQSVIYAAMHQDYSEGFVADEFDKWTNEEKSGEIVVKRLLKGDRGHYGCYTPDTEVLTEKGWLRWDKLDRTERLLAVDIKKGECFFEYPSQYQVIDVEKDDKLYAVDSQYLSFAVTGDHRMVVSHRKKDGKFTEWYFREAKDCFSSPVRYLLNSCLLSDQRKLPADIPDCDLLTAFRLAGFFFGDGIRSSSKEPGVVRFHLRLPRKIAYLSSLGFSVDKMKSDYFSIRDTSVAKWIHQNFSGQDGKKIPEWILFLPKPELAAFFDGLKNSDGTRIKDRSWCYDSCEKEALDLLQAVAHINGFSANMTLNNTPVSANHRACWRISIGEHATRRVETCQHRSPGVAENWIDYSGKVYCATVSTGALMVRHNNKVMVSGNCLEHPSITFGCGYFPHSVMQQARTHRIGTTFDCQSFRFQSGKVIQASKGEVDIEEVFYLRPVGQYHVRSGKRYSYTEDQRQRHLEWCREAAELYAYSVEMDGFSEEHSRGLLPFDYRQHFIVTFNARSLMHFFDMRAKPDAQLEIQQLCDLMLPHFEQWMPAVANWYKENRWRKGRLAP